MTSFNIDQWLSGEQGTRVVEAATEAALADRYAPGAKITLRAMDGWREHMRVALRAALSLTTTEPCPVCWGRVNDIAPGATCKNPDCKGGTVPGESALVVREQLEQVGWWVDYEHELIVDDDLHPTVGQTWDGPAPAFVFRPLEKEDET